MFYRNLSAVLSLTLVTALLTSALMLDGDSVAAEIIDESTTSVKRDEKAIEYLKQNGSYDSLAAAVAAARYNIEQTGGTATADNPANQMSAQFEESGNLRLSGTTQNWQTVFRLKSFGRDANQSAVGTGIWQTTGNRTELRRSEIGLTEYFENRPDGLEQGFILDAKPTGDENLSLILQTSGELKPSASADGQRIILSDASGAEVLHYDKLKVWDAEYKDLTARMTADEAGEIRLEVEDANAVYPLTIDPTFVQSQKLTANDGGDLNFFGRSLAISGDTVVVGAPGNNNNRGAAYVFFHNGSTWTQQAKLVANDGADGDSFGFTVAIAGETIIVGAHTDNVGANSNQGSAYIFIRNGSTWSPQEKITAADGDDGDLFGGRVAIGGDTVIIGANNDDVGANSNQGSAYVYVRSGGAWTLQQKLTANDGAANNYFGGSIALTGGTVIIGAPAGSFGVNNTTAGAAYVFTRSGTTWAQQTKLTASDGANGDNFGTSVDLAVTLSGTFAVVGASFDDVAGNQVQGSAYVFNRSVIGTWSQTQKLTVPDGAGNDRFGGSVAISPTGSRIFVGAGGADTGKVYIFQRENSTWTEKQRVSGIPSNSNAFFGGSVAVSLDTLIVGASGDSNSRGAAFTYSLRNPAFDFDGDGKTDIGIFRPNVGEWWINRSSTAQTFALQFGQSTDRLAPVDFTGDDKADLAFFRPSSGQWFVLRSEDSTFFSFPFGANGDVAVPADYDGDGKADPAVFRPSNQVWYISKSSGGTEFIGFGAAGDKPVVADYDGDGKADIAIFRNGANGAEWWVRRSLDASVFALQFGIATDKPTPGDFTGDGKADIAFWRPSNGNWFVLRSEDFSFFSFPFGANGDTPVAGDYDGDGKFDAGVFRPSSNTWFIQQSTAGIAIQQFGATGDRPIPNAFVP